MPQAPDYQAMLQTAIDEARLGLSEGGIPIGAALFKRSGELLGVGHNRRVQENDPSVHAETDAFRKAGRQKSYRDTVMVTTLAPCWYCCGLVRQFQIGTVVVGESLNFAGWSGCAKTGSKSLISDRRNAYTCSLITYAVILPYGVKISGRNKRVVQLP